MKIQGYVVFDKKRLVRATGTKKVPGLLSGQAFVKLVLEVPDGVFDGRVVTAKVPALDIIRAETEPAPLGMQSP